MRLKNYKEKLKETLRDKNKIRKVALVIIINLLLFIYLVIYEFVIRNNSYILWIMYGLELLSTLAFSFRIWFTAKDKFLVAAIIGCFGWVVAGAQGVLLITEDLGFEKWVDFALKLPSVLIATFSGIYINGIYKEFKNENRR